ncbi:MAG: hypothetical protein OXN21_01535 [Chloroflexota bacterium]|nr:hypothetical protein [Chloroflexota bacterium]
MNQLLKEAFEKASLLPEDEQDKFARFLLAELESEQKWAELLDRSESDDLLTKMADEALADHNAGNTAPLDSQDL